MRVFEKKYTHISLTELPDHISLVYMVPGCGNKCKGCHTPELQDKHNGEVFSLEEFESHLKKYKNKCTACVFLGGEWFPDFSEFLKIAKEYNMVTCLYTGKEIIDGGILYYLDYVKYGPWKEEKGGLDNPNTNQRFIEVATGKIINNKFHRRTT